MKPKETSVRNGIEDVLFPMEYCRITAGDDEGGHRGSFAIDNAGKDTGIDVVYAPCTLIIKNLWEKSLGNDIFWESKQNVRCADGTITKICGRMIHANDTSHLKIGMEIAQGEAFSKEGTSGNANGNHCHMEFGKGSYSKARENIKNQYGVWQMKDNLPIERICFMDHTILLAGVAKWIYTKDVPVSSSFEIGDQVVFNGPFVVEAVDVKKDWIYNSTIGGWIGAKIATETGTNSDQILHVSETFTIEGVFTVANVYPNVKTVLLKELGYTVNQRAIRKK